MSVSTFGVTHTNVSDQYLPHWRSGFSTDTKPTSTAVTTLITDGGSVLGGKLAIKNITASSISSGTNAYAWCAYTLKLWVALKVYEVAPAQNTELLDRWRKELEERWDDLDKHGTAALGEGATETDDSNPGGPITHISAYGLDIGDPEADGSDVVPKFRRKDVL